MLRSQKYQTHITRTMIKISGEIIYFTKKQTPTKFKKNTKKNRAEIQLGFSYKYLFIILLF